jgi:hypothetical protein
MVMPRIETMPGYNHIELDEVHTPSRYFALLSFCSLGGPHCFVVLFVMLRIKSCLSYLSRPAGHFSEVSQDIWQQTTKDRTATWSH